LLFNFIVLWFNSGIVGSSQAPISGVTVGTILSSAVILVLWLGRGSALGASLSILIGGVICVAAAISSDNMQDLKVSHMVGSTPWKAQFMQFFGIIVPALITPPIVSLLHSAYGFGQPTEQHKNPLPAPQASLMATIASTMFYGEMPLMLLGIGAAFALVLWLSNLVVFQCALKNFTNFRIPVMAVALGFYLPWSISVSILEGALLGFFIQQVLLKRVIMPISKNMLTTGSEERSSVLKQCKQIGLMYCAGILTGESLTGVAMAVPIVVSGNQNILMLFNGILEHNPIIGAGALTCMAILMVLIMIEPAIRYAMKQRARSSTIDETR